MNRSLLAFIVTLLFVALFGDNNGTAWAADSGAKDAGPVRNRKFLILSERTTITKDAPKGHSLDNIWNIAFFGTTEKQLNAEGRGDGNTFELPIDFDTAKDADFQFSYRFDYTKGTATLRVSGKDGVFIREFKNTTNYPTEGVLNKMKFTEANKVFVEIYADLNHQAYLWIRDKGGQGGSK